MRIIGIDPGTARIGWAIVSGTVHTPLVNAYGLVTTDAGEKKEKRLDVLFDSITTIIRKYRPDVASIEDLFFAKNAKTAIAVGEARGVIILACAKEKLPVVSYTPLAVKRTITGSGQADKKQVEQMVVRTLRLKSAPKPDDTADACAIALTHLFTNKFTK